MSSGEYIGRCRTSKRSRSPDVLGLQKPEAFTPRCASPGFLEIVVQGQCGAKLYRLPAGGRRLCDVEDSLQIFIRTLKEPPEG